ncbi:MAG: hypothetical protein PHT12_02985 [Patescibacteria group bacterium]|nr:hypothetical protein [Patescibacteria group bacterium]
MKDKLLWSLCLLALAVGVASLFIAMKYRETAATVASSIANLEQRLTANETIVNSHLAEQPTAGTPSSSLFDAAVADLSACGALEQAMPEQKELEAMGFGNILGKGYVPKAICHDDDMDTIAFIMAKKVLTKPTPDSPEACWDACDQDAIGMLNPKTKVLKYVESGKKIGLYGEAYDQNCLIDRAFVDSVSGETIYFYCGSGESGGITHWYRYVLNGDQLTLVQQLKSLQPTPQYDIKEPDMLKQFRRQVQ